MIQKGKLYLLPTTLGDSEINSSVTPFAISILHSLTEFIVEDEKTARRFLKKTDYPVSMGSLILHSLNEHTQTNEIQNYLASAEKGKNIGLLSEAGCPVIADPGAEIVELAHKKNICVVPLVGPSSILLGLMASGFNGQNFCFHGYLPKEKNLLVQKLKEMEKDSFRKNQTQIFIETPYRNNQMINEIISCCSSETKLCIACDITLPSEFIQTKSISEWGKKIPDINKRPALFLIYK